MKNNINPTCIISSLNIAAALGRQETNGSLEVGKYGDLLILNAPKYNKTLTI